MLWLLVGTALAGPPYHACAVDRDGLLAVISPSNGHVAVLREGELKTLAKVDLADKHWPHLLYAHPEGGWWVGAHETPAQPRTSVVKRGV